MGVAALRDLAPIEKTDLLQYDGTRIAVDAHQYLYRYLKTTMRYRSEETYTTSDQDNVAHLLGLLNGLPPLVETGITPVFVFDGSAHELKADTVASRQQKRKQAERQLEQAREAGDVELVNKLQSRAQGLTGDMIASTQRLFDLLGIPYHTADGNAEAQCASLAREHEDISAAYSGDYDTLLFGSPVLLRPDYKTKSATAAERLLLPRLLNETGLTYEQLIDVAVLIGTDYNEGVNGIGPKRGVKRVGMYGSAEAVTRKYDIDISEDVIRRVRTLYVDPPITMPDSIQTRIHGDADIDAVSAYLIETNDLPADEIQTKLDRLQKTQIA